MGTERNMDGKMNVQFNPALTDFRGPTILFCYRRNSVGGGSVRAGFNCTDFVRIKMILNASKSMIYTKNKIF